MRVQCKTSSKHNSIHIQPWPMHDSCEMENSDNEAPNKHWPKYSRRRLNKATAQAADTESEMLFDTLSRYLYSTE